MTGLEDGILVADGHRLVRVGLMSMISSELTTSDVVGVDDFDGVLMTLGRRPGVRLLLLDTALPGMGGMEGLRSIRLQRPDLRVVVMVWRQDRAEAFDALAAGAHGYLSKDLPPAEIMEALGTVLSGHIYVPPVICDLSLRETAELADGDQDQPELTMRQREVLTHLAAGMSNKEIARALSIAEGTVKVHITAAFRTLHVHNRVGAAAALLKLKPKATGADRLGDLSPGPGGPPPIHPKGRRGGQFALACLPLFANQLWLAESGLLGIIP